MKIFIFKMMALCRCRYKCFDFDFFSGLLGSKGQCALPFHIT